MYLADVEAQKHFWDAFQTMIAQKGADTEVCFNDGVHPMHNTKMEYGWILSGDEYPVLANTGREVEHKRRAQCPLDVTDVVVVLWAFVDAQSTI